MLFGAFWLAVALSGAAHAAGPHPVGTGEYHLPASTDPSVLVDQATELWAQVWFPRDLLHQSPAHALPLVVMLHGNHETCGHGSNPRVDTGCEYTGAGTCPEGDVVVPNHLGYSYAAEELASQGAWVVSINANRGITCNSGSGDDSGLNLARGRLVLRHLEMLRKWSGQEGGAPASVGLGESEWKDRIDFSDVGLMGHSRDACLSRG